VLMRGYPSWFYKLLLIAFGLLVVSGILLIPDALEFRLEWDITWHLPGNQRLIDVALHAMVAFVVASIFGAIWSVHMRIGWRHRKNIKSGIFLAAILLFLIVSGIGIYYLADTVSVMASATHIIFGITLPCLMAYHIIVGRGREQIRR
jgi:ABC-type spermidine/putrescine transport system permease subunit II